MWTWCLALQTCNRLPEMLNQREQLDKPQVDISFPEIVVRPPAARARRRCLGLRVDHGRQQILQLLRGALHPWREVSLPV